MASDVGPIPADGGNYLAFLKRARTIAEADMLPADRRQALAEMLENPAAADFLDRIGGPEALLDRLFPRFTSSIPQVSTTTAKVLIAACYRNANQIGAASDSDLLAIERVGQPRSRRCAKQCGRLQTAKGNSSTASRDSRLEATPARNCRLRLTRNS
jgi:hypothetical protein